MSARLTIGPAAYRKVTLLSLVALGFIVVTGGAVRVTGSGLGCPDWPTCAEGRIVAPLEYHALVEFVNRMVTGTVSVMVIVAVLAASRRRPYRPDLVRLAAGLVLGVIGQIVLGGLVVLFHLYPPLVMGHFVLSMVLVANAVVLHHRAGQPDDTEAVTVAPPAQEVGADLRQLGSWLVVWSAVVLGLGTVVTGSGPHAGSHEGQFIERLPFAVRDVARIHAVAVWILLALTLYTLWRARRDRAPASVQARGGVLLAALCAQGAIGYIQYFSNVPAALVAVHIGGATALWVAVVRFRLGLVARAPADDRAPVQVSFSPTP
ncbi:MAG TPA: COX15/CtaA family protein [Acidimicrobiia bacterium]|nr:COX15/CtaA family protein [Acidimicrobiia bacterium]